MFSVMRIKRSFCKMNRHLYLNWFLNGFAVISVVSGLIVSSSILVETANASTKPKVASFATNPDEDDPAILMTGSRDELLSRLKALNPQTTPLEEYRKVVTDTVAPFVDFDLIAKRVMGKYYAKATSEQRKQFSEVFTNSLIDTYAKSIAGYNEQAIVILPSKPIRSKDNLERTEVLMEIRGKDGSVYPVEYKMFRVKDKRWLLENIVLNGVNLGLTFRNQFNQAVSKAGGDVNKAIQSWGQQDVDS
ncbi:MAG: ABC transporter substrate-binding protein [Pseudomonadota bacterium]